MTRSTTRIAAVGFLLALVAGLAIMLAGTLVTGDWYALQLPWSDIGMTLITIGLAGSAVFVAIENLVEPIGRWRLLAVPGVVAAGFLWFVLIVFGLGATGRGPRSAEPVSTLLYSAPQFITVLVGALVLTGLPLLIARPWARGDR